MNLEIIPTISIPIKAWGKKREKGKTEEYTVEFSKVFHLHWKKRVYQQDKFVLPGDTTCKSLAMSSLGKHNFADLFFRGLVKNQLFKCVRFNKSISRKRKRPEHDM